MTYAVLKYNGTEHAPIGTLEMRVGELRYHGDDEDFHTFLTRLPYRVPLVAGGLLRPGEAGYQDAVLHYICWATGWKFWVEPLESPTADG